ncbi:MAG TPA: pitrilysin family protein [Gemmatimonadaceae bacterium]|nr:pitrilysin family protein [Gemmatimonadaceae bacterium]
MSHARVSAVAALLAGLGLPGRPAAAQKTALAPPEPASRAEVRPLAYTRIVLPNGLVALLSEDHAAPLAVVDVWYHVGSKDDRAGRTGVAHLCEHLMALGSPNVSGPQRTLYQSIGGSSPHWANTTEDITHFYAAVPANQLRTALWIEADRMAAPIAQVDEQQLDGARAVVEQERRQNIENFPFGVYRELTVAALFPPSHPYHVTALPPVADLFAASIGDLESTCRPYYVPNNAVIAVSGDFDTRTVRAWLDEYFASIPRGAPVAHVGVPAVRLDAEKRLVLEDKRAALPQLHIDWPGAGFAAPDRLALNALGSVLSLAHFGRLSHALVDDRHLAVAVAADNYDLESAGVFEIVVVPRPGASLTTIEAVVDSVLDALPASPPTAAELARFNAYNAVTAVASLQTQFARADTLAHGEIFAGDPVAYAKQVAAARSLTSTDVERAAARYLTKGRVVMSLVPAGKLDLVSRPELPFTNVTPAAAGGTKP